MTKRSLSQGADGQAGFTLLELLVAMAVLSLLALVMMGSLKFSARVWERTQATADASDAVSSAQAFIRHQLAAAYPQWQDGGPDRPHVLFDGEAQALSFLAPPPAQFGPGTNLRYTLQRSKSGGLEVVWQSQAPEDAPKSTLLLPNISSVDFDYFGPAFGGSLPKWFDSWSNRARLPDLVRIRIAFPPGDRRIWPELIVHPDITVDVRCIYEPLTRTCRGRPE
jgi:general secretion pathway protein J